MYKYILITFIGSIWIYNNYIVILITIIGTIYIYCHTVYEY